MNLLKKSYLKETVNLYGIRFILKFFKNKFEKNKKKILIKSCDGIGDILVRTGLMEKLLEKYGRENVTFLFQNSYVSLGEMLGYNCIGFSRKERKNFFSRLKKMYQLNSMGFSKYINVEFTNDITVGNLFMEERIGRNDYHWQVERNNKYYTKSYDIEDKYVMEQIREMGEHILDKKLELEDIMPSINDKFNRGDKNIVIAVGSTEKSRVCSPKLMGEYIKILRKRYPEEKIVLVGNGDRQRDYGEELIKLVGNDNIENMINKTTLREVFNLVGESFLFIGFESGLYNLCFAMKKRGIILFKNKNCLFYHDVPWLRILVPQEIRDDFTDKIYNNREINSITPDDFEKNLF